MYIVEKVVQTTRERLHAEGDALSEALKSATSYRSIQSPRLETRRIGKLHNRAPIAGIASNYCEWTEREKCLSAGSISVKERRADLYARCANPRESRRLPNSGAGRGG